MSIQNRYDFVLLFDVKDGNPNGDPDAGNLPWVDSQSGHGLVTDVSIKRKIRNYIVMKKAKPDGGFEPRFDIYVKEKAVLGRAHFDAFEDLALPEGMEIDTDEDGNSILKLSGVALDKKEAQKWLKDIKPPKPLKDFLTKALGKLKARKPTQGETEKGRIQMCHDFFDIRTFGAVLSLKTAPNCGQVRGPVQLTFARSVDPIISSEHAITRCAVATEAEAEKQGGDNRTMGRKFTIPYGLYRAHGFISAHLSKQTGFSEDDLALLWESLTSMFDHDRSAARGEMTTRGLYVFQHESELGDAPAHALFDLVQVDQKTPDVPARSFADFTVTAPSGGTLDTSGFSRVTLQRLVG